MHEVAEEDEDDDQFCIDSVIQDTKKPRTFNIRIKETYVLFKTDKGADISIMNEKTFLQLKKKTYH